MRGSSATPVRLAVVNVADRSSVDLASRLGGGDHPLLLWFWAFIAETGLRTPLVLWDDGFRVWSHYGVRGQPTAILLDPSGKVLHTYGGTFDADDVLRRI